MQSKFLGSLEELRLDGVPGNPEMLRLLVQPVPLGKWNIPGVAI